MLVGRVSHFNAKRQISLDVVQVRICQLAQQFIHAEVGLRGRAPQGLTGFAQFLEEAERVELPVCLWRWHGMEQNMNIVASTRNYSWVIRRFLNRRW